MRGHNSRAKLKLEHNNLSSLRATKKTTTATAATPGVKAQQHNNKMGEACTLARDATGQRGRSAYLKVKLGHERGGRNTRLYTVVDARTMETRRCVEEGGERERARREEGREMSETVPKSRLGQALLVLPGRVHFVVRDVLFHDHVELDGGPGVRIRGLPVKRVSHGGRRELKMRARDVPSGRRGRGRAWRRRRACAGWPCHSRRSSSQGTCGC